MRKAKLKLAKMVAAAAATGTLHTSGAAHGLPPAAAKGRAATPTIQRATSARNGKKRRRRDNGQARSAANARGTLTDGQLYRLFGSTRDNWCRITAWLASPPVAACAGVRNHTRKSLLRTGWAREYTAFLAQFKAHCATTAHAATSSMAGAEDGTHMTPTTPDIQRTEVAGVTGAPGVFGSDRTRVLFIATVSHAVVSPLADDSAAQLWGVLDGEHMSGTAIGGVHVPPPPIGDENIGRTMLLAMGWKDGAGLGVQGREGRADPVQAACVRMATDKRGIGYMYARGRSREQGRGRGGGGALGGVRGR